jgi:putative transposase
VLNLERKYLTSEGCVPFTPMPSEPTLEVAALPMKKWVRRKSLGETLKNPKMKGMTV